MSPIVRRHKAGAGTLIALLLGTLAACSSTPPRTEPPPAPTAPAPAPQPAPTTTPLPPESPTPAPAAKTPPPTVAEENSIFFAAGATRIDPAGEAKLRRHAVRLKENPRLVVTLVGHTDNLGSTSYNLAITDQRATAVARMLQSMGVGRTQIRYYGMGDEKTGPTCRTAGCRQKKRRVDLTYPD
ncbi:MAG: OmpA family protein [Rhodocyclales bacterium]|nr:OmpA family protein [Rhodocyclales bacterium]